MKVLKPIVPFEPKTSQIIPEGKQWAAQVKWDGVRMLTYFDGNKIKLFNRRLNERTAQYHELINIKSYCEASSVILDGEIVALENGLPSFQQVMKRDSARNAVTIKKIQKQISIFYMVFDLIYYNGDWVIDRPLRERQLMLAEIIRPNSSVQLVENFSEAQDLYKVIKDRGMEGIVCKDLESTYKIGGKDNRWLKVKYYRDLIAVVGGVTYRGKTVNSLLLGLYDKKGSFFYIGHVGTGKITFKDWETLSQMITPLITKTSPFTLKPKRIKNPVWLKPTITLKVQFMEWTKDHILRQPSVQAFVTVPPEKCTLEETT